MKWNERWIYKSKFESSEKNWEELIFRCRWALVLKIIRRQLGLCVNWSQQNTSGLRHRQWLWLNGWGGAIGATIGVGTVADGWAQHLFQTAIETTAMRMATPIMAAGEENHQWSAKNGFWVESNFCISLLALKSPLMCYLMSLIIAVGSLLSWWLKSWDKVIVKLSQEVTISMSSV